MKHSLLKHTLLATGLLASSYSAYATVVLMETNFGNIEVNLYDEATPATVSNFLSYVEDTDIGNNYDGTLLHRSVPGFVLQSGGYYFNSQDDVAQISKKGSVINEPVFSNVAGTIAMAKVGCQPNSATSEWFINLSDNSDILDTQNGGFTVFGKIINTSINSNATLAAIGSATSLHYFETPLQNYTTEDYASQVFPERENYLVINSISVLNGVTSTETSVENTLIDSFTGSDPGCSSPDSGGGNIHWMFTLLLAGLALPFRRFKK